MNISEAFKTCIAKSIARKGVGLAGSTFRARIDELVRYYFKTIKRYTPYPRPTTLKEYIRNKVSEALKSESNTGVFSLPSSGQIKVISNYPPIGQITGHSTGFLHRLPVKAGKTYAYKRVNGKIRVEGEFEGQVGQSQRYQLGGKTLIVRQADYAGFYEDTANFNEGQQLLTEYSHTNVDASELVSYAGGSFGYMNGKSYVEGSESIDLSDHISDNQSVIRVVGSGGLRLLLTLDILNTGTDTYSCAFELIILNLVTGTHTKLAYNRTPWSNMGTQSLYYGYLDIQQNAAGKLIMLKTPATPTMVIMPVRQYDSGGNLIGTVDCYIPACGIQVVPFEVNQDLSITFEDPLYQHDGTFTTKYGLAVYGTYEQYALAFHPVNGDLYLSKYFRLSKQASGSQVQENFVYGAAGFEVWNASDSSCINTVWARGGGVYRYIQAAIPQYGHLPYPELGYTDENRFYAEFLPELNTLQPDSGYLYLQNADVDTYFGNPLYVTQPYGWNDYHQGQMYITVNLDYPAQTNVTLSSRSFLVLVDSVTEAVRFIRYGAISQYDQINLTTYSWWEYAGYQLLDGQGLLGDLSSAINQDNVHYMAKPAPNPDDFIHHWCRTNGGAVQIAPDTVILNVATNVAEQLMTYHGPGQYAAETPPSVSYKLALAGFKLADGQVQAVYSENSTSSMPLMQTGLTD